MLAVCWRRRTYHLVKKCCRKGPSRPSNAPLCRAVMQTTVVVIVLHGMVILLWASCYRGLCFPSWESAFYFSASSYTTVGYGDVVLALKWRFLGPLESMVGMLMSGISVGLLFAVITHLVEGESPSRLPLQPKPANPDQIGLRQRRHCYLRMPRPNV